MKQIIFYISFPLLFTVSKPAHGQLNTGYHRLVRSSWQIDKKDIIDDLMEFNHKEATAFWPAYNKHMEKWGKVMDYRIGMAQQYCNEFPEVSAPKMEQYMDELVKNDIELTRLQKKWFKRVRKILPPTRSSQYMEIEYEFQLVLLSQIQQRTPSAGTNLKRL